VAGFYAARDSNMPPLLWPSIAPPFTLAEVIILVLRLHHPVDGKRFHPVRGVIGIAITLTRAVVIGQVLDCLIEYDSIPSSFLLAMPKHIISCPR